METQVAYTSTMESTATRTRKVASSSRARRVDSIPEGYMSLDEFGSIFHRKLDEAYLILRKN